MHEHVSVEAAQVEIEQSGCTGCPTALSDGTVVISHDGDTCPVHEADEPT